jgi:hypothetical protein
MESWRVLVRELSEESDQFRFLHDLLLDHLKESVGLILGQVIPGLVSFVLDSTPSFLTLSPRTIPPRSSSVSVTHSVRSFSGSQDSHSCLLFQ